MLNNLGFGSPWFFISIILESCGSFCCASLKLIVGLTDIAQDSPSGIVAFALRLESVSLLMAGVVRRAPVESVLSGFVPTRVIMAVRPPDRLTCISVLTTFATGATLGASGMLTPGESSQGFLSVALH